ncbi:MAG: tetratricopeptide repeat protein [Epsilonproteobacteria bacterium]|nr:tetratricopeptide repeat protein [Campylobacterota bacterium]
MDWLKVAALVLFFSGVKLFAKEFPVCKEYFFIKENQTQEKQTFLEKILDEDPSNVECMLKLASVYLRNNRVSEGFDLIRRAYALDPKFVESKDIAKILDLALRLSRLQEIATRDNDQELWNELGDTYFEIGIFDEAAEAYSESLAIDQNQTKIEILIALCDGNLDNTDRSAQRLRSIVKKEPYNFYANYYLGKVLKNALGNQKEGQKYLLMAEYLIKYEKPEFDSQEEALFLKNDLEYEIENK